MSLSFISALAVKESFYHGVRLVWFKPAEIWMAARSLHTPTLLACSNVTHTRVNSSCQPVNLLPDLSCSQLIQANPLSFHLLLFLPLPWGKKVETKGSYGSTLQPFCYVHGSKINLPQAQRSPCCAYGLREHGCAASSAYLFLLTWPPGLRHLRAFPIVPSIVSCPVDEGWDHRLKLFPRMPISGRGGTFLLGLCSLEKRGLGRPSCSLQLPERRWVSVSSPK